MRLTAFRRLTACSLLVLAAACTQPIVPPSQTPAPTPAPAPRPSPAPTPAPQSAPPPAGSTWMDAAQTAGDWRWRREGSDSIADFASPEGRLLFQVACVGSGSGRQVYLGAVGAAEGPMVVRTETAERQLAASASGIVGRAVLDPRDRLLDAIAFSRGRFAVEARGIPPLYLPSWPEITRVVEDCR